MIRCLILLKTGSYACMLVLFMLYQNIFLLCHPIFGISGKEQHGSVKIIWGSHRDGGRAGGATCQWAIISGVLGGRIFLAITSLESRWEWNEISIEFELQWNKRSWNGVQLWILPQLRVWDQMAVKVGFPDGIDTAKLTGPQTFADKR